MGEVLDFMICVQFLSRKTDVAYHGYTSNTMVHIFFRFSSNSEAFASEFGENLTNLLWWCLYSPESQFEFKWMFSELVISIQDNKGTR